MSQPAPESTAARRVWAVLLVIGPAAVAFVVARLVAVESIAAARRAEWASRAEIENWADPYHGLEAIGVGIGLASALLVGATLAALVVVLRIGRARQP